MSGSRSSAWGIVPPALNNALAPEPSLADAWTANIQAYQNFVAQQRAAGVADGTIDPATGWPTQAGYLAAARQTANALLMGTTAPQANPLGAGFTAYHGSPHSFDRFNLGAIGTGEGAQVYGHGLYFADNEGVAQSYRDNLAGYNGFQQTGSGAPISPDVSRLLQDGHDAAVSQGIRSPSANDAVFMAQKSLEQQKAAALKASDTDWHSKIADQSAELGRVSQDLPVPKGSMYQVNIAADPEHFLDWDAPRDKQPLAVQAFAKANTPNAWENAADGSSLYQQMAQELGSHAAASEALAQAGVPGIRYLDGGSRADGQGTRNTVVFNADTIAILRKYGIAGLIAGGAAANSGANGSQTNGAAPPN